MGSMKDMEKLLGRAARADVTEAAASASGALAERAAHEHLLDVAYTTLDSHRARQRRPLPVAEPPEPRASNGAAEPDAELWSEVRRLPAKQRAAVALRYAGDLSHDEIGRVIAGVSQGDRRPLLGGQFADLGPKLAIRLGRTVGPPLRRLGHRDRAPGASAVRVERLAMGDRQHPCPRVRVGAQARVGPHRGQERLLEAVVGILPADRGHQEPVHVLPVLVQEPLERRRCHYL